MKIKLDRIKKVSQVSGPRTVGLVDVWPKRDPIIGMDIGTGDKSCTVRGKRHPNGDLEISAIEYGD